MSPQSRMGLVAAGIAGLLLASLACGVGGYWYTHREVGESPSPAEGVRRPLIGAPTEDDEGVKWDLEKLVAYLRSAGLKDARIGQTGGGEYRLRQTCIVFDRAVGDQDLAGRPYQLKKAVVVYTSPVSTPAHNRDQAAFANVEHPGAALGWGRFLFVGDPAYVAKLRAALR